jgi:hypothetical protein
MLAAAQKSSTSANLFRLALTLSSRAQEPPPPLVDFFDKVLVQAKVLSVRPYECDNDIITEAIDVAFAIRYNEHFSKGLDEIGSFRALTPAQAEALLKSLEEIPVH